MRDIFIDIESTIDIEKREQDKSKRGRHMRDSTNVESTNTTPNIFYLLSNNQMAWY